MPTIISGSHVAMRCKKSESWHAVINIKITAWFPAFEILTNAVPMNRNISYSFPTKSKFFNYVSSLLNFGHKISSYAWTHLAEMI